MSRLLSLLALCLALPAVAADLPLPDSDVVADRLMPQSPDRIYAHLLELRNHEALWGEGCSKNWVFGQVTQGPGASAQLVYVPSLMHRKLTATLSKAVPDRSIDIDHAGNKGFVTRWTLTPEGDGTRVSVHTYVEAPPKPFVNTYYKRVQPAWTTCHQQALDALEKRVAR